MADPLIRELTSELPALLVVGPRATGKTTTAKRVADTVLQLDRPAVAGAVHADPDAALRDLPGTVLLDEWQAVPDVLGAVKRAVDEGVRPGRFILTGSVRARSAGPTWPGTGRVVPLAMSGLVQRELRGDVNAAGIIDRLVEHGETALTSPAEPLDLRDYVELALTSGFPEPALNYSERARRAWLAGYVDQVVHRDAVELGSPRDPHRLRSFLEALASNSAGTVAETKLASAAGIDRRTAASYLTLMKDLLVLDELPAWSTQRLKRLTRAPKRYLCDAALIATLLGDMNANGVMTDADVLGRIIETFVVAQLRAEATVSNVGPRLHHLRQDDGRREIDLVVETAAQKIIAIEIKATSAPKHEAARHLAWMRDAMPKRFLLGVVLHSGPRTFRLDDRIFAAPISVIWD